MIISGPGRAVDSVSCHDARRTAVLRSCGGREHQGGGVKDSWRGGGAGLETPRVGRGATPARLGQPWRRRRLVSSPAPALVTHTSPCFLSSRARDEGRRRSFQLKASPRPQARCSKYALPFGSSRGQEAVGPVLLCTPQLLGLLDGMLCLVLTLQGSRGGRVLCTGPALLVTLPHPLPLPSLLLVTVGPGNSAAMLLL